MPVEHAHSPEEYAQRHATAKAANKLLVVDFTATWCGPCKAIAPVFEQLSAKYADSTKFLKVDVDEMQQVSAAAGVSAMPTFQFFKHGVKVDEMKGANAKQLETLIKKHSAGTINGAEGSSQESSQQGHVDLTSMVQQTHVECLNQSDKHTVKNLFVKANAAYLESDCDAQLMLSIPFQQTVKVHSIKFTIPEESKTGPKTVKLYTNRPHLGFDEAETIEPTQTLELTARDFEKDSVTLLRFVKFQKVNELIMFISSNQSGDEDECTQLSGLTIFGTPVLVTKDLSEMNKKQEDH